MPKKYVDVGGKDGLPEDARITLIGNQAMLGQTVGILLDHTTLNLKNEEVIDDAKVDRYIEKVLKKYPQLEVVFKGNYFKDGSVVLVKFQKKAN